MSIFVLYDMFQTLGYSSERAIISDATIPSQTLAANGDPPRTNNTRFEQGRLHLGSQTVTKSYEVLL